MVIKAKKGFYEKLSRKELQNMCKLYGLPANKSHSQLEKSLLAFLEEGIDSSICDLQKASPTKCKGSNVNHRKAQRKSSAEKCLSFSKEDMVEFRPETVRRYTCPQKNAFASPSEISAKVRSPPFQFYVRSEDGLNLCVDLNSSPSDWSKKFKSEVHITENLQYNKSRSLHDDLECLKDSEKEISSFGVINSGKIRDRHEDSHSSPCSEGEKFDQSDFDQQDKSEMLLEPLSMQTTIVYNCTDVSEKSMENHLPSCSNCDSPDQMVSVADSCAKAQCTVVLDSNVTDARYNNKSIYDIAVSSVSGFPLSHAITDHATANFSRCQNMILENDSSLPNPLVVYLGSSVSSSVDMQSSEVASCNKDTSGLHYENGGVTGEFQPKDKKESEKSGLANSSELNHMHISVEEGERSNILNVRESSECSEFVKPSEKTCFDSDKLENSSGGQQKKRKHVEGEHQSSYAQANVKILRSMKRKKDLPRRSMRLLSKDV